MFVRNHLNGIIRRNLKINYQRRHKVGQAEASYAVQKLISLLFCFCFFLCFDLLFDSEKIVIHNNQKKFSIDSNLLQQYVEKIYNLLNISTLKFSIIIASNEAMRNSYFKAFQKRKTTDILAWAPVEVLFPFFPICCYCL